MPGLRIDLFETATENFVKQASDNLVASISQGRSRRIVLNQSGQLLWPNFPLRETVESDDINLTVVPLERIGVEGGKSGSRVFVSYLGIENSRLPNKSLPLVLKVAVGEKAKDLEKEKDNYDQVRHYLDANAMAHISAPLRTYPPSIHGVAPHCALWAPFANATEVWRPKSYWLSVRDLRDVIQPGSDLQDEALERILNAVYAALRGLHRHAKDRCPSPVDRNLARAYDWYFRGLVVCSSSQAPRLNKGSELFRLLDRMWPETQVRFMGRSYPNPLAVLENVLALPPQKTSLGAVHGDLHPRNIVLTSDNTPRIIDFGWTRPLQPISQDFALLECNFRFFELHPSCCQSDVEWMAGDFLYDHENENAHLSPYCQKMARAIKLVRTLYYDCVGSSDAARFELQVGLFIVALGLARHLHACKNQLAWQATILSLAKQLSRRIRC